VIAEYMLSVMKDGSARTADRLEAAKWLADRVQRVVFGGVARGERRS
jgi:hypothetical protein